ncbi:MAG: tRNA uridine 5-carboxymethylaminomethyl modification enzyme MnmG [Phycisphaerales bacterium]|nr:MAG: tRNA uridine 5-carboxymethylaminomethyl modification enzyme MnmG [Phycisphaerales bacterium]
MIAQPTGRGSVDASHEYAVVVVGGGHAGVEAAWSAANLLGQERSVALVTLRLDTIGVMSCNPAIGGLAKGQLVNEIDAMGGLMGLAADATGINFAVLNRSRGPAVRGPRTQSDKHAYARAVASMIASRPEIVLYEASVEGLVLEGRTVVGVRLGPAPGRPGGQEGQRERDERTGPPAEVLRAKTVVLTTGTFMRGLMHTGEAKTPGGRFGEAPAVGISGQLRRMGLELGRLRTGTPPRLKRDTIDWDQLEDQLPDPMPEAFSALTPLPEGAGPAAWCARGWSVGPVRADRFPVLPPTPCKKTATTAQAHEAIRQNLHRAPMFRGDLAPGPRYCPSIEDKVHRFADRPSHTVFLEPESLESDWVYCNGIATSLPVDVQEVLVRSLPGCRRAHVYRWGYAVEYDSVRPHQIEATGQVKRYPGLFLAGQINGTSGYEEAAAQGLIAGINAALRALGRTEPFVLGRDQAYAGVLMDDLVTRTPVEPYRMFTSRAEHRLLLRSDNAADRLTPLAIELGLLATTELGRQRTEAFRQRQEALEALRTVVASARVDGRPMAQALRRPEYDDRRFERDVAAWAGQSFDPRVLRTVAAEIRYEPYIQRQQAEIRRQREMEHKAIPPEVDYQAMTSLRTEARQALARFRPATFGQASRLEGVTPADLTLLAVLVAKQRAQGRS